MSVLGKRKNITVYRVEIILEVLYWHNKKHADQRKGIETPKINLQIYNQLIHNKESRSVPGERPVSSTHGPGNNWISACRIMRQYPHLTPYMKTKSMDQGSKIMTWYHQITRRKHLGNSAAHWHTQRLLRKRKHRQ